MSVLIITTFSLDSFFASLSMAWANFRMRIDERFSKRKARRDANKQTAIETKKHAEPKIQKSAAKTPAVPGDKPVSAKALAEDKNNASIGDKFFDFFINSFKSKPKAEKTEKSPAKVEPVTNETNEPLETETSAPTIFVRQDVSTAQPEIKSSLDTLFENTADDEQEKISFTPIAATGELNADLLEAETIEEAETWLENEIVQPKRPQNFDEYDLPTSEFLTSSPPKILVKEDEARALAKELVEKTKEFNATGQVVNICPGPVVTTYEFKPDPGVKYSRITGLADDLCLALEAESIRIDRIPGKAFVGIEVPNSERETIYLREVIESNKFTQSKSLLTLALGKTIDGLNYVSDLAKMPHLLIAGATGAGKSVGVNTLVVSILYKAKPDEVKFIMVDPKQVELGIYADIPHLATPIITDPKRASNSLKWAVGQMERRYKDLAGWGVRNIDGYNAEVKKRNSNEQFDEQGELYKTLPFIVIIIDELADLMMVSGKEVEESITRLAQMARAVGIHLVLATQRPSVDVITGLIKANFPARISFRVSSKVDSRTIIDGNGAESLLGKGDMLFLPPATSQIIRVHGAFVDETEIHKIVAHVKAQGAPEYDTTITKTEEELVDNDDLPGKKDALFLDALRTVVQSKRASTSLLQRHLRIGYGRAAAILDAMVREGYIGDMDGSTRARPILQKAYEDLQEAEEGKEL
ncbi:MAG: DNA translocase FtsK [Acidobacteria bacterium]|nr:DNA translocase FtsK [Acidobacteriota bacterium]